MKISVLKHETDNGIIECALGGRTDVIAAGNKDMLTLKNLAVPELLASGNI